eukprot:TRINITY_DN2623_c0_g3_i9.p1 TRINITY_DN2623_c0_g3~~TRINITY_DN2623_c0_g3_i9.p1  ORF type:complete len:435 (+),score=82.02 TRINITY_DN2623_c0_g3_i9:48-1307(+)
MCIRDRPNIFLRSRNSAEKTRRFGLTSLNNSRKRIGNSRSFLGTQTYGSRNPVILSIRSNKKRRAGQSPLHTVQSVRNSDGAEKSLSLLNRGKDKLRSKQYSDAIVCFEKAYELDPKNAEALLYKGRALMDDNKLSKAVQTLERAIAKNPNSKPAHHLLAAAYRSLKNAKKALESLNSALSIDGSYLEALISRADLYMSINEWAKAKEDFEAVARIAPKNSQVYLSIAECETKLGNTKEALDCYNKVVSINPFISKTNYMKKARLEIKMKRYSKALTTVERISDARDLDACMLKAKILEKAGRVGDAAMQYELMARHEQMNAKAVFKLAKMGLRSQDYYEAYFNIRRAEFPLGSKMGLYKTLIEGMVSLMKEKDGMSSLTTIEDDIPRLKPDIKYAYHAFKAYGHMTLHEFDVTLQCIP